MRAGMGAQSHICGLQEELNRSQYEEKVVHYHDHHYECYLERFTIDKTERKKLHSNCTVLYYTL